MSNRARKRIYLDYASTTPLDSRVQRVMEAYFSKTFGNPSSIHAEGVEAKKALDGARISVARSLEGRSEEVVFTSGGTEANNLAIFGVVDSLANTHGREYLLKRGRPHVVTTTIEHASILEPLRELEKQGRCDVTYVEVEPRGIIQPERIISALRANTVLVSVQYANNEIGTIQPIRKIGQMLQSFRSTKRSAQRSTLNVAKNRIPIFHTDACQAPLYLRCLVNALGVDLMTLDGHKMYGPKGIGVLYVRRGTPLAPILLGGGQEKGMRSTTENIPAVVGFAEALRIATGEREKESIRITKLRNHLYSCMLKDMKIDFVVNGSMKEGERLPNNLNVSFPGIDTEFLTLQLDASGVAVSTKSSCLTGEKESYVVKALGGGARSAGATLRFTLGRHTTKKEIEYTTSVLLKLLEKGR
ncbi:MAG: cysteine desulfurase NifS [Candidatus Taylorbacteria bacterium CG11_big_fil_rev_8_21_14_0_20_46_11]|uniref:Cysteine desulfurase NifS n=1 Tax=Candidatus Taylorbacteria bacterium CG11_big_fil_rev_8_21_14_0_20_46_11 TaxID=1975025 RepID=A0A2H0KC06_9BACT|nr:MAG: cysteine desulfurase NifS [Candidatus Taylorbacteria bacterium CG11_big_fil_rev_8_21_14_0_20_46_11]